MLWYIVTSSLQKQPTPRKGTETPRRYGTGCKSARKQPTPRKGTETLSVRVLLRLFWKQLTPRKGTETVFFMIVFSFFVKQPTPRKGTETTAGREILRI